MNTPYIIRNTDITLPGVTGRHVVMHISDSHLCVRDEQSPESERAHSEKREGDWSRMKHGFAEAYGDPLTEANDAGTLEVFRRVMRFASDLQPELLILSGDTLEYMHGAGARQLRKMLTEYGRPYICVPGNHEDAVLDGVWDESVRVYRGEGFTFAGIDDRLKTVTDDTLTRLSDLIREGVPLFPVVHIPLCTARNREAFGKIEDYYYIDENTEDENGRALVRMMSAPEVRAVFCGHLHGFTSSELYEGVPQISCSSSMIGNIHLIDIHG